MKRLFLLKIIYVCLVVAVCVIPVTAFADTMISYPGTAARAMGGAYTAVGQDASAVWYNPAALSYDAKDLILEYSNAPNIDYSKGEVDSNEHAFFGAFKSGDDDFGWGLFIYTPYSWNFLVFSPEATGDLEQDLYLFGLGLSKKVMSSDTYGTLRVGGTIEGTFLAFGDSELVNSFGSEIEIDAANDSVGFSGSVGVLYELPVQKLVTGLKASIGAVYRFESVGEDTSNIDELDVFDDIAVHKPSSWDVGFSVTQSIDKYRSKITLSGQYGRTEYSDISELLDFQYRKASIGAEFVYGLNSEIFKFIALRGGYYKSNVSDSEFGFPDVNGYTFGLGTKLGDHWGIDLAYEKRELEFENGFDQDDVDLFSIALTYSIGSKASKEN